MILRTPPLRKRRIDPATDHESPISDRRLMVLEDPIPVSSIDPSDQMVCTYHCRQMVKAEFLAAFDTAQKQVVDYESKVEILTNELSKSEEERKNFRDHLRFVEQDLAACKGREQALQERLLKEVGSAQENYHAQLRRCNELEIQLKKEVDLRKKAESSESSAKERAEDLEVKLLQVSESREREKNRLHKEISHLQGESKLFASRITSDLEKMRLRADNSEKESILLKKQLEDLREQLNESLNQKSELEHGLSASSHEVSPSESHTLVKHLQEELHNYEAEVREARRLKSSHVNSELLKERLLEEKSRREKAELELSKLEEVQLSAQKLENELISWKSLLSEIPDVSSRHDIPQKFVALQKEAIESMVRVGEVTARLKELEVSLELAEHSRKNAEKDSLSAKEKADNLSFEVKRLERMLSLITVERDRLRKDITAWSKQKSGQVESGSPSETRVKDLEASLLLKENVIKELDSNLRDQREVVNRQHEELKFMNEKLNTEAGRVKSLERECDRLCSEISLLESKLGHGDFSAANTKVLRMVNTLGVDNEAKHTIEALQAELQKTQAKLQAVEELKGKSAAGSIMDADVPGKLAQLKGQIATLEKREERYKAVFAEKISVFRRACCALFGYKIVMDDQQRPNGIPVTHFILQSVYAQNDDEKLEFDYESGNANILVNDYTSQPEISHQVEIFIRKWNSIPAFTANLTMESFNKRTLS